jgi:hypothetical protein
MRFEVVEIGPAGMLWKWRIVDQWGQEQKVIGEAASAADTENLCADELNRLIDACRGEERPTVRVVGFQP